MRSGHEISSTRECTTSEGARKSGARLIPVGTVLMIFKLTIGKIVRNLVPVYTNVAIAALNIRDSDGMEPGFLAWALRSMDLDAYHNRAAMGKTLNSTQLRQIKVPTPGIAEQRRIAAILDRADALRSGRRDVLSLEGTLRQSILRLIIGREASGVAVLGDVVEGFRYGTSNKSSNSGYPALRIPNVVGGIIDWSDIKLVEVSAAEAERLALVDGDLLVVRTNGNRSYVGRCAAFDSEDPAAWPGTAIYASYLIRMRPDCSLADPVFLQDFLNGPAGRRAILSKSKTSAGQYNINIDGLRSVELPNVPLAAQRIYSNIVKGIVMQRHLHEESLTELESLFDSLQHRAFRGEI